MTQPHRASTFLAEADGTLHVLATPLGATTPIVLGDVQAAHVSTLTLPGAPGLTTYITGFQITGLGATAASTITVQLSVASNVLFYNIAIPAGVTTPITPLIVTFGAPVSAGAQNAGIILTTPSFGAGNTSACIAVQGFQA